METVNRGRRSDRATCSVGVVEEGELRAKCYAEFINAQLAKRTITSMVRLYAIRLLKNN